MKNLLAAFIVFAICSCTSQKNTSPANSDTTVISGQNETKSANPTKNIILNNPSDANETKSSATPTKTAVLNNPDELRSNSNKEKVSKNKIAVNESLPSCLLKLIARFKDEEIQNPPRKIYSYTYNGNTVYYVTPPCCDFFSDLYDMNCNLIAHPDGGITGRGDGRAGDFIASRTNEKLVWEDNRKYR